MKVEFRNEQLKRLYESGHSRKYPLDEAVIRKFVAVVGKLDAARDIHDSGIFPRSTSSG